MNGQNYRVTVTGTIQGFSADDLPGVITRHIDGVNRDLQAGVTDFSIDSIEPLESRGGYGVWSWAQHHVTVSGTMPGWSPDSVWEAVEYHFHGLRGTVTDFTIVSVEEIETEAPADVPAAQPVTETVAVSGKRRWVRRLFGAAAQAN